MGSDSIKPHISGQNLRFEIVAYLQDSWLSQQSGRKETMSAQRTYSAPPALGSVLTETAQFYEIPRVTYFNLKTVN